MMDKFPSSSEVLWFCDTTGLPPQHPIPNYWNLSWKSIIYNLIGIPSLGHQSIMFLFYPRHFSLSSTPHKDTLTRPRCSPSAPSSCQQAFSSHPLLPNWTSSHSYLLWASFLTLSKAIFIRGRRPKAVLKTSLSNIILNVLTKALRFYSNLKEGL